MTEEKKPRKITEFSDAQIAHLQEGFSLFCEGKSTIPIDSLPDAMHSLGLNPSIADIEDLVAFRDPELDPENIDFQEFKSMILNYLNDEDFIEEIIQVFREQDPQNTGKVNSVLARKTLVKLGLHLKEEETAEMLKEHGVDDEGELEYESFIRSITARTIWKIILTCDIHNFSKLFL